jgi:hypothetical protein
MIALSKPQGSVAAAAKETEGSECAKESSGRLGDEYNRIARDRLVVRETKSTCAFGGYKS